MKPLARSNDIVVQEVFDELVVYDLKRDWVHSLNPTAAFVWQHCDGKHTLDELTALLQQEFQIAQAEALLWPTLERLETAHLLQGKVTQPGGGQKTYTRREMLKIAGLTVAMLPVIKSIVAPSVAQAASSDTEGCTACGGPASHALGFDICCCQIGNRIRCTTVSQCERIGGTCIGGGPSDDDDDDDDDDRDKDKDNKGGD